MKQLVQNLRDGRVEVLEVPVPEAAAGKVVVRVGASLVSTGTERTLAAFSSKSLAAKALERPDLVRTVIEKAKRDGPLAAWNATSARLDTPMPVGYSLAGTVVAVGEGVTDLAQGDRVLCVGGGHAAHAEFVAVPRRLCCRLPDEVASNDAAFGALAATAMHAIRLSEASLGETCCVLGLGLVGQLASQLLRAAGLRVLGTDLNPWRVELCRSLGTDAVVRQQVEARGAEFTGGKGFDHVLIAADTASAEPVQLAAALACDRGSVIAVGAVGMDLPRKAYYEKELRFRVSRSYGPGRYDPEYEDLGRDYPASYVRWTLERNLQAFVDLLAANKLKLGPLITHRFPIDDGTRAYELLRSPGKEQFLAILLTYAADAPVEHRLDLASPSEPVGEPMIGFSGAGLFAQGVLLPAFRAAGASISSIVSERGFSAKIAAQRHDALSCGTRFEDLLSDPATTAVAIATRHSLHAKQALAALRARKHVFLEKPACLTRAELNALDEAAAIDRVLMVGYNRRFAPMALRMKEFFGGSGPLSIHYRVLAGPLPAGHWLLNPEQGGGRLLGECCHFADWTIWMAGSAVKRVCASRQGAFDPSYRLALDFENGSIATIEYLTRGSSGLGKERIEIHGGNSSAVLDDFRRLELRRDGRARVWRHWLRGDKGHQPEVEAFLAAVKEGKPSPVPWPEVRAGMLVLFQAVEQFDSAEGLAP